MSSQLTIGHGAVGETLLMIWIVMALHNNSIIQRCRVDAGASREPGSNAESDEDFRAAGAENCAG